MLILTVKPTWAKCIFDLDKDVENRVWKTSYRGRLFIHTSQKLETQNELLFLEQLLNFTGQEKPKNIIKGAIIGSVNLVNIITNYQSMWAMPNQYHWIISDPILLDEPIYCKGKLGLWRLENQ